MTTLEGYRCESCEHVEEDAPESPLYECSGCGTTFNRDGSYDGESNRCPDCRKFAAKIADHACPECSDGSMDPATIYRCGCGKVYATEEEVEACAVEDAIPPAVKKKRDAERKKEQDDWYADYQMKARAKVAATGLESVVEQIDDHSDWMFNDDQTDGQFGLMLYPHVIMELRCLVVDELERQHAEDRRIAKGG